MTTTKTIEMKQTPFDLDALGEPHLPVLLLLDTSASMKGKPMEELISGFNLFIDQTAADELAMKRVDVAVMTFSGAEGVKLIEDFKPLSKMVEAPPLELTADGNTPMGEAIERAVEVLRDRCRIYDEAGVPHYRGWIFMLTDGAPTDDITKAKELIRQREDTGRLKFFSVAVNRADVETLKSLGPRVMQCTEENRFKDVFNWLSESMTTVSASRVGEEPGLPCLPENFRVVPTDW